MADEGGAVYPPEGGEALSIVVAEVGVEALVGIHAQELSYDLDGQDLGVAEFGRRIVLA